MPEQTEKTPLKNIALVLQGGGALGAYQAGVFEVLSSTEYCPSWVAGVSIGAINAAIIVGNEPGDRVEKLREFWHRVSSGVVFPAPHHEQPGRNIFNWASAQYSATVGIKGFYRPRTAYEISGTFSGKPALSLYDTSPLRVTLEELVDFRRINSKVQRLSVGAVDVRTGNSIYFDNFEREIRPEHIMASGALPPAFAPVEIDGNFYWDGGIVSNTPLHYVLDRREETNQMILQLDLFSACGELPNDLSGTFMRHKDIMYSSRTRLSSSMLGRMQKLHNNVDRLIKQLPPEMASHPAIKELAEMVTPKSIDLLHLIYRPPAQDLHTKDYDFSRTAIEERWAAGAQDIRTCLEHPDWLQRKEQVNDIGVNVYDLTAPAKS